MKPGFRLYVANVGRHGQTTLALALQIALLMMSYSSCKAVSQNLATERGSNPLGFAMILIRNSISGTKRAEVYWSGKKASAGEWIGRQSIARLVDISRLLAGVGMI